MSEHMPSTKNERLFYYFSSPKRTVIMTTDVIVQHLFSESMQNQQTIAYLRVSTTDQDLKKNRYDILQLANDKGLGQVQWVEETVSGRVSWRKRKIAKVLEQLQAGDTLIVSELSRLGRSMLECMEILSIAFQKGIHLYAVKGNWRLDNSIQSKIVAMAFSMAAEIERDLISQRTKEALAARKKAGITSEDREEVGKASWTAFVQKLKRYSRTAQPSALSPNAISPLRESQPLA